MAVFIGLQVLPLLFALWMSLFKERLVGGTIYVGLDNYARVLADPKVWDGVRNTVIFGITQVPVMLVSALILALLLDSALIRARGAFRIAIYLPYAVPSVIAAMIWGYMYGPAFGPIAQLAEALGGVVPPFLSDGWMIFSIANIVTWEYVGYNMIIMFAALQAVPKELEDAAAIDGAGPITYALFVKIPLIKPAILLTVIFSIIGTFQLFNEPMIMKALAPSVIGNNYTPNVYSYTLSFVNIEYNYAAAVSFVIGLIVAIISYVFMFAVRDRSEATE